MSLIDYFLGYFTDLRNFCTKKLNRLTIIQNQNMFILKLYIVK